MAFNELIAFLCFVFFIIFFLHLEARQSKEHLLQFILHTYKYSYGTKTVAPKMINAIFKYTIVASFDGAINTFISTKF